jgi:hypothetical protein
LRLSPEQQPFGRLLSLLASLNSSLASGRVSLSVVFIDLRPQTLRLSPKQRPFGRLLWYFASLQFVVSLCTFHLFLFSAQRWAHSQSRSPTASCNKGGRNNVADAGGEVTV